MRRRPQYKQISFDTAVRNPERYIDLLKELKDYEGETLNDETLLNMVSQLYLAGIVKSNDIQISDDTEIEDINDDVRRVNSTRKADGGFSQGYQARFWTYVRTPSELGLVYAQYNKVFEFSSLAKLFLEGEIDEQEAFSIQALKYNRKSPYKNVCNDFNFFRFILEVLLRLRENDKSLSYEQFIISTFSRDGGVERFLNIIENNSFNNYKQAYVYLEDNYENVCAFNTATKDYPDVVIRILVLAGFIALRYSGRKLIMVNENRLGYIRELLEIPFTLGEEEKSNPRRYFEKLDTKNSDFLRIVEKYGEEDQIVASEYHDKLSSIIREHNIDEQTIIKCIKYIDNNRRVIIKEFKEIPLPVKLEFYIAILLFLKYGNKYLIKPNYKTDHIGKPYSHAPGNKGDIEVSSNEIYWLVEVTLMRSKQQQYNNETTTVIRHFTSADLYNEGLKKYLSFVAPFVHKDTEEIYGYLTIKYGNSGNNVSIKPYGIEEFLKVTTEEKNLEDMEKHTRETMRNFRDT